MFNSTTKQELKKRMTKVSHEVNQPLVLAGTKSGLNESIDVGNEERDTSNNNKDQSNFYVIDVSRGVCEITIQNKVIEKEFSTFLTFPSFIIDCTIPRNTVNLK